MERNNRELCFGRKMNGFEAWSSKPATDEVAALNQRALQIKNLVENHYELAKINIKKSQEIQKRNQDANSRVDIEFLSPGTSVFVKTEGILSKESNSDKNFSRFFWIYAWLFNISE